MLDIRIAEKRRSCGVVVVVDVSLSFLYYIYDGERKHDDTAKMHRAKWYLTQTTQMPLNAMNAPCIIPSPVFS